MEAYRFAEGAAPLLVSAPHVGTDIPADLANGMTEAALAVPDTDWHIDRLYDFAAGLGASTIFATQSRTVIDLNRPADGTQLYPGASNTELCPLSTFEEQPIYRAGRGPDKAEIDRRVARVWRPYHDKIAAELARIKAQRGVALLFDAHSIKSVLPRFFQGKLPDFNLGSGNGTSCAPELMDRLAAICRGAAGYTTAVNGRFKGGAITRHFGRPAENIHAVQLELAQSTYMNEAPPFAYRPDLADGVQPVLKRLLEAMLDWARMRRA
ncbi:MAG: N-formylglutamate deformylase [Alphaproteobacteria bacterium]|nr:N-formylglutamate deformylase [Alphaproteobacteria bacterium]